MRLGQHFLINKTVIKKIVASLEIKEGDFVVEIGPGHGEITKELVKYPIQIIAIEKDKKLADDLKFQISKSQFQIIGDDVLKILPEITKNLKKYKLVGNIPYYLTGFLFRIISELENKPQLVVFTIQKEVAERLTARPPKMNLLAASVQIWSDPKIIDYVPAGNFQPKPKVDSAIIKLKTLNLLARQSLGVGGKLEIKNVDYYKFIKILFKQPRKTIFNNLRSEFPQKEQKIKDILKENNIKENYRPQNLTLEQIKKLSSDARVL